MDQTKLSNFFLQLSKDVEDDKLSDTKMKLLQEFYMSYMFKNQYQTDLESENPKETEDMTDEDFKKFLTMGWYVYSCINDGKEII